MDTAVFLDQSAVKALCVAISDILLSHNVYNVESVLFCPYVKVSVMSGNTCRSVGRKITKCKTSANSWVSTLEALQVWRYFLQVSYDWKFYNQKPSFYFASKLPVHKNMNMSY
jgi:hypothetical protein